jgi:hypothetical protein
MNDIIEFILQNRQTGSTTQLVKNIESGGYLVVLNSQQYDQLVSDYPHLKSNIITLGDIRSGKFRGLPRAKLYFDNNAIYEIVSEKEKIIQKIKNEFNQFVKKILES